MACKKISLVDQALSSLSKNNLESFLKAFNTNDKVQYIIAPSMSFDKRLLEGIDGIEHYELRSFWEILRVKRKNTYVTFVSSEEVSNVIFEHFIDVFKLSSEEISRITFIRCPRKQNELSLTKNILNSPKCIERIKSSLKTTNVILECFVRTVDEKILADLLGAPSWYNHPQLDYFHTKSGNRFIVGKDARMPRGISDLFSKDSVIKALIKLKNDNQECESFMVKLNFGVSGQGNMKVLINEHLWSQLGDSQKKTTVEKSFVEGTLFNQSLTINSFVQRIIDEGAVVEEFIGGNIIDSPSAQLMVSPDGVDLISTHRQILDSYGQKFIGGEFPCESSYRDEISRVALKIGEKLRKRHVYGVSSVDFLISKLKGRVYCDVIELNIRKGGTTHPFMLSSFAIKKNGIFNGGVLVDRKQVNYTYRSNDNFYPCKKVSATTSDLIHRSKEASILFNEKTNKGVIFHLLNTYASSGKIGYTVIGTSKNEVHKYEMLLKQVLRGTPEVEVHPVNT